jgi:hypothetical protein
MEHDDKVLEAASSILNAKLDPAKKKEQIRQANLRGVNDAWGLKRFLEPIPYYTDHEKAAYKAGWNSVKKPKIKAGWAQVKKGGSAYQYDSDRALSKRL